MKNKPSRNLSVDALRGLIMILMALDHANYFVAQKHPSGEHWGGNFPDYQDGLAFATRLVTHLSAPGFFFLMGVGMYFFSRSRREHGWSEWKIAGHFFIRGTILIALQLTVVNYAWKLGPQVFPDTYIGVLVALGGTMILASLLLRLEPAWWLILAAVAFLGTEYLHPGPERWGLANPLGLLSLYSGGNLTLWSNYPILPWLELVLFGLFFGARMTKNPSQILRFAPGLGLICLLAFGVLRSLDGFGNIRPMQSTDWIGFLNVVKYPPSMTFTLLTMGVNLLLLGGLARLEKRSVILQKYLAVFGREPLFFYLFHLYLYLGLGILLTPAGSSIQAMYPLWFVGVVILYGLCLGYTFWKQRNREIGFFRYL
jgi:uncharacterized membrane protein